MDGTLIDSGACVERQWARWAERHDFSLDEVMAVSHGRRTIETMRLLAPHVEQPAELESFLRDEAADLLGVVAFEGAAELLASLPADRWAIVTSSSEAVARARLHHCGFPDPHVLVSAEHVEHGKPHPEPYLTAARLLGVPPDDCIVLEDANSGIAAARAAGMQAIGVAWSRETLECDTRIRSFRDLSLRFPR